MWKPSCTSLMPRASLPRSSTASISAAADAGVLTLGVDRDRADARDRVTLVEEVGSDDAAVALGDDSPDGGMRDPHAPSFPRRPRARGSHAETGGGRGSRRTPRRRSARRPRRLRAAPRGSRPPWPGWKWLPCSPPSCLTLASPSLRHLCRGQGLLALREDLEASGSAIAHRPEVRSAHLDNGAAARGRQRCRKNTTIRSPRSKNCCGSTSTSSYGLEELHERLPACVPGRGRWGRRALAPEASARSPGARRAARPSQSLRLIASYSARRVSRSACDIDGAVHSSPLSCAASAYDTLTPLSSCVGTTD